MMHMLTLVPFFSAVLKYSTVQENMYTPDSTHILTMTLKTP